MSLNAKRVYIYIHEFKKMFFLRFFENNVVWSTRPFHYPWSVPVSSKTPKTCFRIEKLSKNRCFYYYLVTTCWPLFQYLIILKSVSGPMASIQHSNWDLRRGPLKGSFFSLIILTWLISAIGVIGVNWTLMWSSPRSWWCLLILYQPCNFSPSSNSASRSQQISTMPI